MTRLLNSYKVQAIVWGVLFFAIIFYVGFYINSINF